MNMSIKLSNKLVIVFVAIALLLPLGGMSVASAQTSTTAQMQAQILQLQTLIAQLQALLNAQKGVVTAAGTCPYTWTRELGVGSSGPDVMKLQQFLNASPDTRIATVGAGSMGQETMYYGALTAAAVTKFQTKHKTEVLTPAGLVNGTGSFDALTRAKANKLCVAKAVTPTTPVVSKPVTSSPEKTKTVLLAGEGDLKTFEIDTASDTDIEEDVKDAPIAELTLAADNGDIEITRVDVALVGANSPQEEDPWKVFENLSLWLDGKLLARIETDNRNDYLDKNAGTLRFSNLGIVSKEGTKTQLIVAASVKSGVSGAGTDADWTIAVNGIRYFDADGVATDERSFGEIGDEVAFSIVKKGHEDKLDFSLAPSNPEATDIIVDERQKTNDVTILNYYIEAKGSDIELDRLYVTIDTSATTSQVIDDVKLKIGNQTFSDDSFVANSQTSATYRFDIDGDVVIKETKKEEVRVLVSFRSQDERYDNGTTIQARVTSIERDATRALGADDITNFSGTAVGKTHTLVASGIVTPNLKIDDSFKTQGRNDTVGVFTLKFVVKAIENDFYITNDVSQNAAAATAGIAYQIDAPVGFNLASSTVSATLDSTADEKTDGVFTVREGETETFTLTVVLNPNVAGYYRVALTELNYDDDTSGMASTEAYVPVPVQKYRTKYNFINN